MREAQQTANALWAFLAGPWSSPWFLGNTLDSIGLLLAASLGALASFRGGTFNLGGEGQIYLGGLAASVVLLAGDGNFPLPGPVMLFFAALAAMITGGLLGSVSGILKRRLGANELITSFLLSSSLIPVADYLIEGPWRDKGGNLLAMPVFAPDRMLLRILPPSHLSISFFFALILVICGHIFLNKTVWGYQFRLGGAFPGFAAYGGMEPEKCWIPSLAVSGALSAMAGFFAVAGTYDRCHLGFPGGLGWNAIAVSLICRNRPLALIPAAIVYGWLRAGADSALLAARIDLETSAFIQAAVLLAATLRLAGPVLRRRRV
jgi:simple sugar transport system permease protein